MINITVIKYFESHITIEPVFDEKLIEVEQIAKRHGFKVANLLMQKRVDDTPIRSKHDTFMTGHSHNVDDLMQRTSDAIIDLKDNQFKVWRYKIESALIDSKINDEYNLLSI